MNDEIVVNNNRLFEFQVGDNASIFYNVTDDYWYCEFIDLEDGEEFEEGIDIDSTFPIKVGDDIVGTEDLEYFKQCVEEGWDE